METYTKQCFLCKSFDHETRDVYFSRRLRKGAQGTFCAAQLWEQEKWFYGSRKGYLFTSYNFTPANWVQDATGHTCAKPAVGSTLWQTAYNKPELWLPFSAVAKWKAALTNQQDKPVLPCGHHDVTHGV